jgi:hypothetical protein
MDRSFVKTKKLTNIINQMHTFSGVYRGRFHGLTLCLQPSERTQFLMIELSGY